MAFLNDVDKAVGAATCNWLNNQGGDAILWAATGAAGATGNLPVAVAAGLGVAALEYGCSYNPGGHIPAEPGHFKGCRKCAGAMRIEPMDSVGNVITGGLGGWTYMAQEVLSVEYRGLGDYGGGSKRYAVAYRATDGLTYGPIEIQQPMHTAYIGTVGCSNCLETDDGIGTPDPTPRPVDFTTDDGCKLTVNFVSWLVQADGKVKPVVKITPVPGTRASGGIIGGCNFMPLVAVGGGGGGEPPWISPWQPGPDGPNGEPWWLQLLKAVGDAALEAVVERVMDSIFGAKLPATVYRLVSVCETDAQGEPVSQSREVSIPSLPMLEGLAARIDALPVLDQGLKDFKQPICENTVPSVLEGEDFTVRFVSDEPSPYGTKPLRKRFSYRSQVVIDPEVHRQHWEGFTWTSGSVMVFSTGLSWGKPQVWASTAEEGKRVLRHAAAVCGVDLDSPRHKFVVRTTTNLRFGPELLMRPLIAADGRCWLTTRSGPSGPPELV